jgi:hypothetical protein
VEVIVLLFYTLGKTVGRSNVSLVSIVMPECICICVLVLLFLQLLSSCAKLLSKNRITQREFQTQHLPFSTVHKHKRRVFGRIGLSAS